MNASLAYLSQEAVKGMIDDLWDQIIRSKRKFKMVVGIERGGLHISIPLAECLGIPHHSVKISRYDDKSLRKEAIIEDKKIKLKRPCLIVDDLIDDGGTLLAYKNLFGIKKRDAVAVLFWNRSAPIKPDFYCMNKPKDWIVFPWEQDGKKI